MYFYVPEFQLQLDLGGSEKRFQPKTFFLTHGKYRDDEIRAFFDAFKHSHPNVHAFI